MLFRKDIAAVIGIIGFMTATPNEQPVDTRPVAHLCEQPSKRTEAVVYRAPDDRFVRVYLTDDNQLRIETARFLVNLDESTIAKLTAPGTRLPLPNSRTINDQPAYIIGRNNMGDLVAPVFPEWLATIAEAWNRPPRGTPAPYSAAVA